MNDIYYKYTGFRGERYFRMTASSLKVLQICINNGENENLRGRGNNIGIYLIDRMTMISNYMNGKGLIPITRTKFEKAKKRMLKLLK